MNSWDYLDEAPFIPVKIHGPKLSVGILALVDTGAKYCALHEGFDRELIDALIEGAVSNPDSVVKGRKGRLIAQIESEGKGFGNLLIRVGYEEIGREKVIVSAYWSRPGRYTKGVGEDDG